MVPSIYSVTPTEGLASGRERVSITGWGFALPQPGAGAVPTVRVLFDGVPAPAVLVFTSTSLMAVTPEYRGHPSNLPAVVDVTVQNLNALGEPVAGESFTLVGGWTFRRHELTHLSLAEAKNPPGLTWLCRQLLLELRRGLVDEVVLSATADYSTDPALQVTAVSRLPCVVLDGPEIRDSPRYAYQGQQPVETVEGDAVTVSAPVLPRDLLFGILLLARNKPEALNLQTVAMRYFERRPTFAFTPEPSATERLAVRWYLENWRAADTFSDQTFGFANTLKLEGVKVDDKPGSPVDDTHATVLDDDPLDVSFGGL